MHINAFKARFVCFSSSYSPASYTRLVFFLTLISDIGVNSDIGDMQVDTFDCKRGSGSVAAAAVEATCCAPCSIYISRAHHAMQHSFVPDPCDNRVQRCDNCFRNMECIRVAAAQLSGAGDDELRRLSVSLDEKQPLCGWGYLAYFLWWPCLYVTYQQIFFPPLICRFYAR